MKHHEVTLDDKYALESGQVFLTGIQALVRLPLDQKRSDRRAGLNTAGFISGYRGSPLGGYDQQLERARKLLDAHDVKFWQGLNEDLGATAVWGSQQVGLFPGARYDGVFGIWYGKAPGVDRTGDVFKHANFAGVSRRGGVLALAGDDHACKSSTLPSQSEFAFQDAEIPVLNPSSVQEVLDFGLYGLAMSRFTGAWTAMIALADTMDSGAVVRVDAQRLAIVTPDLPAPAAGLHLRRGDTPLAKEARLRAFKLPAAQSFVRANGLDRVLLAAAKPRLGVVATGQAVRDVFEALEAIGLTPSHAAELGLTVYKVAMPWPLEPAGVRAWARGLERILVVEHKRALIETQLRDILYDLPSQERPRIVGKRDEDGRPLLPDVSAIAIPEIAEAIYDRLAHNSFDDSRAAAYFLRVGRARTNASQLATDAHRRPHYCSGCPHNTSTVVPDGSRALAGIGCHYMATFMPERHTDMTSQMGGEGAAWIGQAPFTDEKHVFVNLGDGTYSHSGSLAIRAALTAGVNITYKILYNDAVAMTGGQPVESGQTVPQLVRPLQGEGVRRVVVVAEDLARYVEHGDLGAVEIYHRSRLAEVQEKLRQTQGVSVLIYDQMCAAEKRRRIKRKLMPAGPQRAFINSAVCEGCGDCSKVSNCLSIEPLETELGRKRQINQSSCNQDLSCINGFCPSFVTVEGAANAKRAHKRPEFDATGLPVPAPISLDRCWNVLFAGVGGSGVTTTAAIIAMAAHIDAKASSTLDMTGLAQKGGAVFSHLRIARDPQDIRAGRIPPAACDVLVGCDLIVAASPDSLGLLDQERTAIVANTDVTPTAEFIVERDKQFDVQAMSGSLAKAGRSLELVNAEALAEEYLYDQLYANMIMAGYAWQKGLIPASARAIYRAIRLNGAAVQENLLAFDLGRLAAAEPEKIRALTPPRVGQPAQTLDDIIAHRMNLLTEYQNSAYATRYHAVVARVRAAEHEAGLGDGLARAVAINLSKLMAYKDEYEVARLYTNAAFEKALAATFAPDPSGPRRIRVSYHLAPPLIAPKDKATGLPRKIRFGPWLKVGFQVLARLKGLRGGRFDVFGYSEERRMERALIERYIEMTEKLVAGLSQSRHATAIALAQTPQEIRGFGHVKRASLEAAAVREARLWEAWEKTSLAPAPLASAG